MRIVQLTQIAGRLAQPLVTWVVEWLDAGNKVHSLFSTIAGLVHQ